MLANKLSYLRLQFENSRNHYLGRISDNIIMMVNIINNVMGNYISANNKRIAKNTLMLYFRMLFSLFVSLYTSRVVLQVLGVEDYGIYNVIGGFVAMFSLLSRNLNIALQRFFSIEIGLNNVKRLELIFCTSINIFLIISIIIFILGETFGLWFFYNYMNIPVDRFSVALWVFQISLISFLVGLISIPYSTLLMAYEHFKAYAYISIIDVILKLFVVLALPYIPYDKLVTYSVLILISSILVRFIYAAYCSKHFSEIKYKLHIDKPLLNEMLTFTSWNFIGSAASLFSGHGINVILNIFCGVVVNAARGVANQVYNAVASFVTSFNVAVNPQINKLFAQQNYTYLYSLIFKTSRFAYYLIFVFFVPIVLETEFILKLWLGIIPDYSISFIRIMLVIALIEGTTTCLHTLALAVGKIALYQMITGGIMLLYIPISIFILYLDLSPVWVLAVGCVLSLMTWIARICMLYQMINFPWKEYLKSFLPKVSLVTIISLAICVFFKIYLDDNFWPNIVVIVLSIIITSLTIFIFGMSRQERSLVLNKVLKKHD